ncbi:SAM-dependent methyltransferase [Pseudomonas lopnurensis]|jgi:precorrin-6B methylase 2|uniref:SAM-dependent methyltransferase n=1 Tax=Pseudomonas lopnurensis TaxID=1477517 RepID=UPI00187AC9E7|nr:50S ribosomal protein L11 methyltransferase [Pseudomonas lopnurensis]
MLLAMTHTLRTFLLPLALFAVTTVQAQTRQLDVPYVPTPDSVVARMLEMAEVGPGDRVIDLGSGDGRIAIAAVRDRGAHSALGVDLDPVRIAEAELNAQEAGVSDQVAFEQGDLFEKDISEADVLTMYLLQRVNLRLRPVILDTLQPGTRVVSHAFSMDDWQPDQTDTVAGSRIYLWIVPAKVEGDWQVETDQGRVTLSLTQQFQEVQGSARTAAGEEPVQGRLRGDELHFTLGDREYIGKVNGDRIEPLASDGTQRRWSAQRS